MIKRIFDLIVSFLGLLVLSPLFIILAITIKMSDHGPVLHKGKRVGRHGKPFAMFKFRSMVVNADKIGGPWTPGDDPRLTAIGKRLRRFKLDELPQLVNVLLGDMSIVGPRPEVPYYIDKMTAEERACILSVMPGITDFASIWNSCEEEILRGAADPDQVYQEKIWPEKKRLQMKYVNEQSFLTDLKIIWKTFLKLLR